MQAIDLRTALVLTALMCSVMGVVLLSAYYNYPRSIGGLREWAAGCFVFSGASSLFALRALVSDFPGIIVANGLHILGYALLWKGLCQLLERPTWSWRNLSLAMAIMLGLLAFWTYVLPSIAARSLLIVSISCVTYFALMWTAWNQTRGGAPSPALWFFALTSLFGLLSTLIRLVGTLTQPDSSGFLQPSPQQTIYLVAFSFLAILHFLSFFLLATVRLHQELLDMAHIDPLTGALNRRGMYERLPGEIAEAQRKQLALSMVLCDLDHFKQINDRHGHAVGDAVLVHFVALINSLKRPHDLIVRLGGEEFALILPEASTEQAMLVAQRLHDHLNLERHDGVPAYTSSLGVASLEMGRIADGDPRALTEEWFKRADVAIYRAKAAGRNRIEAAVDGAVG